MSRYTVWALIPIMLILTVVESSVAQSSAVVKQDDAILDVVIVGGGIAGLTAAYYLDLDDYDIRVLEKNDTVGGRAFSLPYRQFMYAGGAEYLGPLYGPLQEIVAELDLVLREIPYPMDVHASGSRLYYGLPGRAMLASKTMPLDEFRRFGKTIQKTYADYEDVPEWDSTSSIARLDDISAYDWFMDKQFPQFFIEQYNVTFRGLFGANIHEISALGALAEIAFDFEGVDLEDDFSSMEDIENDASGAGYRTEAYSFDNGIAEIPVALGKYLGDSVEPGSEVIRVEHNGDVIVTTYLNKSREPVSIQSDSVILATPAEVSLSIGRDVLSPEQREILETVEYAPMVTLALFSSTPIFDKGFDLSVSDNLFFTDVYDATWIPRFYNKTLKKAETYITTVYVAGASFRDLSILSLADEEILSRTYADLEKILPGSVEKIEEYKIFRFSHGYPVMTVGAYKRLSRLHEIDVGPAFLAGDYTIYPTFEAAADSGELAAERAIDYLEDSSER